MCFSSFLSSIPIECAYTIHNLSFSLKSLYFLYLFPTGRFLCMYVWLVCALRFYFRFVTFDFVAIFKLVADPLLLKSNHQKIEAKRRKNVVIGFIYLGLCNVVALPAPLRRLSTLRVQFAIRIYLSVRVSVCAVSSFPPSFIIQSIFNIMR